MCRFTTTYKAISFLSLFVSFVVVGVYAVNVSEMIALRKEMTELKALVEDRYLQARVENANDVAGLYKTILTSMELDNTNNVDMLSLAHNSADMASTSLDMLHSIFTSLR